MRPATDADDFLARVLKLLGGRFSDLRRVPEQIGFFYTDDFIRDDEAVAEHLSGDQAATWLAGLADRIEAAAPADAPASQGVYEEAVRAYAEELGVKAGDLIHPCRVALTGQTRSAGMFEVMELVGAPRTVARLRGAAAD